MEGREEEEDLVGLIKGLKLEGPSAAIPTLLQDESENLIGLIQNLKLDKPDVAAAAVVSPPKLRAYQQELVDRVRREFDSGTKSILMYLPTGGGKSAICAAIAQAEVEQKGGKTVGIFVHRDELASQMEASLVKWTQGMEIGFIKANKTRASAHCNVHIISIQTFAKRYLKKTSDEVPAFDLIVIDEAHHTIAPEYLEMKRLYEKTGSKFLGLTATPFRLKRGELLGDVFDSQIFGPNMAELQRQGYLVPFVTMRGSSGQQVGRKAAQHKDIITAAVLNWKKRYAKLKTLAFCVNLAHAALLAECFEAHGIRAAVLSGKDKQARRDSLFAQSREGLVSVLCTVDVVSEGVDTVWIDCLLMLRPTESLSLYIQQLGRGLRPFPGKAQCTVLDEVGNIWDHGFANELDMLAEMHDGKEKEMEKLHRLTIFPCQGMYCRALASKRNKKLCSHCMDK